MPALLEGIKLVRSIDAAQLARYGVRSNDVVNQLLVIAKVWIADETAARGADAAALVARFHQLATLSWLGLIISRPSGGGLQVRQTQTMAADRTSSHRASAPRPLPRHRSAVPPSRYRSGPSRASRMVAVALIVTLAMAVSACGSKAPCRGPYGEPCGGPRAGWPGAVTCPSC